MKDLTITEAVERLRGCIPSGYSYSIGFEYQMRDGRATSMEWTLSTHFEGCEIFSAPTLRGAVERAENHHIGAAVEEAALQEQLDVSPETA